MRNLFYGITLLGAIVNNVYTVKTVDDETIDMPERDQVRRLAFGKDSNTGKIITIVLNDATASPLLDGFADIIGVTRFMADGREHFVFKMTGNVRFNTAELELIAQIVRQYAPKFGSAITNAAADQNIGDCRVYSAYVNNNDKVRVMDVTGWLSSIDVVDYDKQLIGIKTSGDFGYVLTQTEIASYLKDGDRRVLNNKPHTYIGNDVIWSFQGGNFVTVNVMSANMKFYHPETLELIDEVELKRGNMVRPTIKVGPQGGQVKDRFTLIQYKGEGEIESKTDLDDIQLQRISPELAQLAS